MIIKIDIIFQSSLLCCVIDCGLALFSRCRLEIDNDPENEIGPAQGDHDLPPRQNRHALQK